MDSSLRWNDGSICNKVMSNSLRRIKMKILGLSSSPRKGSNTDAMIQEILKGASSKGAETSFINFSQSNIKGCVSCMYCRNKVGCATMDDMQKIYDEINDADFVIFGSPVYMGQVNGQFKILLDRLFPYLNTDFTAKINKPSMLVYSQGAPGMDMFKPYFKMTTDALNLLGFKVSETYCADNGNMPGSMAERQDILVDLFQKGEALV
jgi:multimeric flavodoxin WrbA